MPLAIFSILIRHLGAMPMLMALIEGIMLGDIPPIIEGMAPDIVPMPPVIPIIDAIRSLIIEVINISLV